MPTIDEIKNMTREQINENWDEVKAALSRAREPMTKSDIAAIKDRGARLQAIRDNMHLFDKELRKDR